MKQTCDCCGGVLRRKLFGQGAVCKSCGMQYTKKEINEHLSASVISPSKAEPETGIAEFICPGVNGASAQFVLEVRGASRTGIRGVVRQGGIGLGDTVYINRDDKHPYRIWYVDRGNEDVCCAKSGDVVGLGLCPTPARGVMKKAVELIGIPNPSPNGYNYPGTMRDYFWHLITTEFPQYQLQTDVTYVGLKIPVSFLLCRDACPVLAIFLIDSTDSSGRYQVQKAARIFSPEGVACTHFYENYRNDVSYVIDRVRNALG